MTPGNIIALCGVIITLVIAQIAEMKKRIGKGARRTLECA